MNRDESRLLHENYGRLRKGGKPKIFLGGFKSSLRLNTLQNAGASGALGRVIN